MEGFLGSLHALVLIDNTVILATGRKMCEKKPADVCHGMESYIPQTFPNTKTKKPTH